MVIVFSGKGFMLLPYTRKVSSLMLTDFCMGFLYVQPVCALFL